MRRRSVGKPCTGPRYLDPPVRSEVIYTSTSAEDFGPVSAMVRQVLEVLLDYFLHVLQEEVLELPGSHPAAPVVPHHLEPGAFHSKCSVSP